MKIDTTAFELAHKIKPQGRGYWTFSMQLDGVQLGEPFTSTYSRYEDASTHALLHFRSARGTLTVHPKTRNRKS